MDNGIGWAREHYEISDDNSFLDFEPLFKALGRQKRTFSDLLAATDIEKNRLRRLLEEWICNGIVRQTGYGKGTHYELEERCRRHLRKLFLSEWEAELKHGVRNEQCPICNGRLYLNYQTDKLCCPSHGEYEALIRRANS